MAVYEFECAGCGRRFEVSVPMAEHDRLKASPPACPGCGSSEQTRQVYQVNVQPPFPQID